MKHKYCLHSHKKFVGDISASQVVLVHIASLAFSDQDFMSSDPLCSSNKPNSQAQLKAKGFPPKSDPFWGNLTFWVLK